MPNSDKYLYLDSETCGLFGMPVLLQYAVEDGPIHLVDIWKQPIGDTLDLIEWICTHTVVGFNLSFDWFHIAKIYTVFSLCPRDWIPKDHIEDIAALERQGQEGPCLKPANSLDLLLHSRKGPYQSLMARSDIRIRRVPTPLACALAQELEERVEIDGIYFARSADQDAPRWNVFDCKNRATGEFDPNFKDVVLRFNPAGGLKFLAEHALGYKPKYHYADVEIDRKHWPKELGYAPYATAISSKERNWEVYKREDGKRKVCGFAWPGVIKHHIDHWASNQPAREYASDDIKYTRELCAYFAKLAGVERLPAGDDDSVLACMVPVVRWRGFKIDSYGMRKLLRNAMKIVREQPCNINKPAEVKAYIRECMDDTEYAGTIRDSTKKANLQAVANNPKWAVTEPENCTKCGDGMSPGTGVHEGHACQRCKGTGVMHADGECTSEHVNHPASVRAWHVLRVKMAAKEVELYKKLIRAKKFHASFNVVGTLSSRMSGGDGLNAQGIKSAETVRGMFPLAPDGYQLSLGDFASFEITLADAVYNDPDLRKAILSGKKIHALFGMCLFPGKTYEEVVASNGTDNDMYTKGKQGVFAMVYGGDFNTLVRNLGIAPEVARAAFETWNKWFPRSAKARERTFKAFCSMSQPDGTHVEWADPADYVESFLGFRRYFTLENEITRVLHDLAKKPPKEWRECKIKVKRSDHKGIQTAYGAVASALYGAAFQIQAGNQRAAANHEIQSPGGQITKAVQRRVWDLQPVGIHDLIVMPANVHDEILCPHRPLLQQAVAETIRDGVESFRSLVPLIGMDWVQAAESWADKKEGPQMMKIRPPRNLETLAA